MPLLHITLKQRHTACAYYFQRQRTVVAFLASGYNTCDEFGWFSSLLCSRTMLRRPSVYLSTLREEGCSSNAFARAADRSAAGWNNHADLGSAADRSAARAAL